MSLTSASGAPGVARTEVAGLVAARRPAFSIAGQVVTWQDVLVFAEACGDLDALAWQITAGRRMQTAETCSPTAAERRAAARAFRYARGLLSAEELEDWLARWGVSAKCWVDWLDRSLRLDRSDGAPLSPEPGCGEKPASRLDGLDAASLWVDAVCSGQLEASAEALAGGSAAWVEATGRPLRSAHPGELQAAWERYLAEEIAEAELDALVGRHASDWLTIDLEWAVFPGPDPASEAVACGRFDGERLAEVARRTGTPCSRAVMLAEDLAAPMRSAAISAPIDTAVLAGAPGSADTVLAVRDRKGASLGLPGVRVRAEETARRLLSAALVERWVRWDERPARR